MLVLSGHKTSLTRFQPAKRVGQQIETTRIDGFHSFDQRPWNERNYLRKTIIQFLRIVLVNQYGRLFFALVHQYGRHDDMWKQSKILIGHARSISKNKFHYASTVPRILLYNSTLYWHRNLLSYSLLIESPTDWLTSSWTDGLAQLLTHRFSAWLTAY